jgi:hypothetical protein
VRRGQGTSRRQILCYFAGDRQPCRSGIREHLGQERRLQAGREAPLELREPAAGAVLGEPQRIGVVRATVAAQLGDGLADRGLGGGGLAAEGDVEVVDDDLLAQPRFEALASRLLALPPPNVHSRRP